MSPLWSLTLRQLATRMVRTVLTMLSVTAAVGAVVAVVQTVMAARAQHQQLFTVITGRADLEILARDGSKFGMEALDMVRKTPGIGVAAPYFEQISTLFVNRQKFRMVMLGIDPQTDPLVRQTAIVEGHNLQPGEESEGSDLEALIDRDSAGKLGVKPGQTVRVLTRRGLKPLTVVGVFMPEGVASAAQGVSLVLKLAGAQHLFNAANRIDVIRCVLDGTRPRETVMVELSRSLPESLTAQEPTGRVRLTQATQNTLDYFLILAGGVAVLAAGFVLLETFLITIEEQRGAFSLLRLVGMTTGQTRRLVLLATVPVALVGTALGLPLGWLGGMLLTRLTGQALQAPLGANPGLDWGLLAGAIVGPVLTLLAALWPAHLAGTISPLESLRQAQGSPPLSSRWLLLVIGLVLIGIALTIQIGSVAGVLSPGWFLPAALVGLASTLLVVPAWVRPLTGAVSSLLRPLLGYELVLARNQVTGPSARNALAAGILFLATAAGVAVNNTSLNLIDDVKTWYDKGYPVQYFLRSLTPDTKGTAPSEISQALTDQAAGLPGVTRVERVEAVSVSATAAGRPEQAGDPEAGAVSPMLLAREFGGYPELPLSLLSGTPEEVRGRLREGEIVLGSPIAHRLGLVRGDEVELRFDTQTRRFRVAGVSTEYLFGGRVVLMERETARRTFGLDGIDGLMIETAPGGEASAGRELQALAREHGLLLHSFAELGADIHSITGAVHAGIWLLLAVSFLLCGFGIVNTLTMNVLEQSRELGLLRLVGLKRAGLPRLVLLQTVLLSACGILPGLAAGLGLAWMINLASGRLFGNPVPFHLHAGAALACGLLAFLLALVAAWPPALRAARLDPLEAVRRG